MSARGRAARRRRKRATGERARRDRTRLPRDRSPLRPSPTRRCAPSTSARRLSRSRRTSALREACARGVRWAGGSRARRSRSGSLLPTFVGRIGGVRRCLLGLRFRGLALGRLLDLGARGVEDLVLVLDEVLRALLDGAPLLDPEPRPDGELVLVFA